MDPLFTGVAVGFAVAAPVGPIGVLCIRRTVAGGMPIGFASGLGAALADGLYAAVAVGALTLATAVLARATQPLHLIGGAVLLWLGITTAFKRVPAGAGESKTPRAYAAAFVSTFVLTAVNPATILSFAAIVAGAAFGAQAPAGFAAVRLVAGVFVGSALWWLLLSGVVGVARRGITQPVARAINVLSGAALASFGVVALVAR